MRAWGSDLAARIVVSNLHKNTKKSFSETFKDMYMHFNKRSRMMPLWSLKMFMKSS